MQPIAIIAAAGTLPGAQDDLQAFWRMVEAGESAIKPVPQARWGLKNPPVQDSARGRPDCINSDRACLLAPIAFDPGGFLVDEALLTKLDPLFQLLLHTGRQAWRQIAAGRLDPRRVSVVISNLILPNAASARLAQQVLGDDVVTQDDSAWQDRFMAGLPAGLLGQALGLGGGCFTLDAACASAFYAIKVACDQLEALEVDAVLTGGVSRPDALYTQMGFSQLHALSVRGISAPFDASGDGLVVGEGAGLFVLKRLVDAEKDGDTIWGVIRGIGLSNDREGSLLAPHSEGQLRAMRAAYHQAGWSPRELSLFECHATGTPRGDSVEVESLRRLLAEWPAGPHDVESAVIGSVKSNVGHLLTAAGAAGLLKTLLAFQHATLPPTANFRSTAAGIDLSDGRIRVLSRPEPWLAPPAGGTRRAALSAFGFGGINAHLLLESYPGVATPVTVSGLDAPEPIAVVGLAARFGGLKNLRAFQEAVLGGAVAQEHRLRPARDSRLASTREQGYFLAGDLTIMPGKFRIPPQELRDMLPQQLLALLGAESALEDAGLTQAARAGHLANAGVLVGIGLDPGATNYHLRWQALAETAPGGIDMSDNPPLSANRTIGSLGGMVASRIAREFRLGGPSFTVSGEETSGIRAIALGMRALQRQELDLAVAVAVELAGDPRHLWAFEALHGQTEPAGEGVGAVVLKRLSDAQRDGDRIYAVLDGAAFASGGAVEPGAIAPSALREVWASALKSAEVALAQVGYVESAAAPRYARQEALALGDFSAGEAPPPVPIALGQAGFRVGLCGVASSMASVIKTILALYQEILPGHDAPLALAKHLLEVDAAGARRWFQHPRTGQYWYRNRVDGPRRAAVQAIAHTGECAVLLMRENETVHPSRTAQVRSERHAPLGLESFGLFVIHARDEQQLALETAGFRDWLRQCDSQRPLSGLARDWFAQHGQGLDHAARLILVAGTLAQLEQECEAAVSRGFASAYEANGSRWVGLPQGRTTTEVALVYPGSGNHFPGMGVALAANHPEIPRLQDTRTAYLRSQVLPERFAPWRLDWPSDWESTVERELAQSHGQVLLGQVSVGALMTDWLAAFDVPFQHVIGYSLGETAGLVSTGIWRDRDTLLERMAQTPLFSRDLAGRCEAARAVWSLNDNESVDWLIGVVNRDAHAVHDALVGLPRAYLLLVNQPQVCVVGGAREAVMALVERLDCAFLAIDGVTTVHCEVAKPVEAAYRALHRLKVYPLAGVRVYSGASGEAYVPDTESVADAIVNQALDTVDFSRVIERAYEAGARIFIELGPRSSCTRMIKAILGDRPHVARAMCIKGVPTTLSGLQCLAQLLAEGVSVNLNALYGLRSHARGWEPAAPVPQNALRIPIQSAPGKHALTVVQPLDATARLSGTEGELMPVSVRLSTQANDTVTPDDAAQPGLYPLDASLMPRAVPPEWLSGEMALSRAIADAHAAYLGFVAGHTGAIQAVLARLEAPADLSVAKPVWLDRAGCLRFAQGAIADVLGERFAPVDTHPTRVRLPDEPLMLVDRILSVTGEACSLGSGTIVTEHDVMPGAWYLDAGRIPTCIAVEAGQADLFLSAYLGIDFETRGLACYRLLDAVVTFHRALPLAGATIRYDIAIDRFMRQGDTHLFFFRFEATVDGEPLLSMQNGCAGFFSAQQLQDGRGIVLTSLEQRQIAGKRPENWPQWVPMRPMTLSLAQVDALREGRLVDAFGSEFAGLPLSNPVRLPGGRLRLVEEISLLDPTGGRFGLGLIRGEARIQPDDWFLTCHFVDDQVMPGTLMYECCMHTLRIFLMRMGWVGEDDHVNVEPVPGVSSTLKCRGQVLAGTKRVTYEIVIRELGLAPTPYALADALMYADDRPIVSITNMSIRMNGLGEAQLARMWGERETALPTAQSLPYNRESILAFAIGKPSEAFGDRYRVFDAQRIIARLPGPPYMFLDRVVSVTGAPWVMQAGAACVAQYDVPHDAWYFADEAQPRMPFAVLLEVGLQPCGWLAAYVGSALTSDVDLSFRNLGGQATQHLPVTPDTRTLTTRVELTKISSSGGMIIQDYIVSIHAGENLVYQGDTTFGFFTKAALKHQVGVRGATLYEPDAAEKRAQSAPTLDSSGLPMARGRLRMLDELTMFAPGGGRFKMGYLRGTKTVDPAAWFFAAHFYQDPVIPGSLGLESLLQLLKAFAQARWTNRVKPADQFESIACGVPHAWQYRGQIIPSNRQVVVEAHIKQIDDGGRMIIADGQLSVDGLVIYHMTDFGLRVVTGQP